MGELEEGPSTTKGPTRLDYIILGRLAFGAIYFIASPLLTLYIITSNGLNPGPTWALYVMGWLGGLVFGYVSLREEKRRAAASRNLVAEYDKKPPEWTRPFGGFVVTIVVLIDDTIWDALLLGIGGGWAPFMVRSAFFLDGLDTDRRRSSNSAA